MAPVRPELALAITIALESCEADIARACMLLIDLHETVEQ
jgi:hypothetical protein